MNQLFIFRILLHIILLFSIAGCASPTPELLPAGEILQRAVERTRALQGFHFLIDRDGAPAYLNPDHTLAFGRAEGVYNAPDQARAAIRVIAPGLVTEVKMVAMGDQYWESDLVSGAWQKLPAGSGFNPAALFDPQSGFQEILLANTRALQLEGLQELEELPGQPLYSLSGELDGAELFDLSYGLIGPGQLDMRLWIDPETFEVVRIQLDEPAPPGEEGPDGEKSTLWQVDFWDFDQVETVAPPVD